jgi:ribosome modulation factor
MEDQPRATFGGFLYQMEGRAAYDEGQPITACPYEPQTKEEQRWLAGWHECDRLAQVPSQRLRRPH